jgi:predicted DNA-binding transcriptional regulator AlpA
MRADKTDYRYLDQLPDSSVISVDEVLALVRVSRSTWYEGIKKRRYPPAVYIGPSSPRWPLGQVRQVTTGTYKPAIQDQTEDQKAA